MSIAPDTKDWTWVLTRPCPECGFDADAVTMSELPGLLRSDAARWPRLLARDDAAVRPDPERWSPLEYACHLRDVLGLGHRRLAMMRDEDEPVFADWDQDAAAIDGRYDLADPATVASELVTAAGELADALAAVDPGGYGRRGRRSDGAVFTIGSFAGYILHESIHHLVDVTRDATPSD